MPPYPGLRQCMEVSSPQNSSKEEIKCSENDEEDWAAQYQAYLDEKEIVEKHNDTSAGNNSETDVLEGEDWAIQYAEYCTKKEKEFFLSNPTKDN